MSTEIYSLRDAEYKRTVREPTRLIIQQHESEVIEELNLQIARRMRGLAMYGDESATIELHCRNGVTVVSLDMAYRSFREVLAGWTPARYAAFNQTSSPKFPLSSRGRGAGT